MPYCDYLIEGEGELAWYELAKARSDGRLPEGRIIRRPVCDLSQIRMPYYLYNDEDIANRLIYVEATRGCPFGCEFCLSSLSKGVREFDLDVFLREMKILLERGVRQFKFVDRTFNLKIENIRRILDFFKTNWRDGLYLHFEIFPDRLSGEMLEEIRRFPDGGLHLEAGVQSFISLLSKQFHDGRTNKRPWIICALSENRPGRKSMPIWWRDCRIRLMTLSAGILIS